MRPRSALAACSASGPASADPAARFCAAGRCPSREPAAAAPTGSRPASPAVIAITSPAQGAVVNGSTAHIIVSLQGAQLVAATSTTSDPTGHVHLYVDNVLVSMNYGLEQDLPVHPGTYVLKAEFVAADHAPFNPRVWSPEIIFTVH